jgi:hypothetical protein
MIEVRARSGSSIKVYEPLLRHRWSLYANDPTTALSKLQLLPPNTVQAILEHLYANMPVSRTNLPAFKACRIIDSIPFTSTYHRDMTALLHDESTSDFLFLPRDGDGGVHVHRFLLALRSGFFRAQFGVDRAASLFRDPNMGQTALQMFTAYLYTGLLEAADPVALVDLFGAGADYQMRDVEEIDFLAMMALKRLLTHENAAAVRARAEERGIQAVIKIANNTS